MYKGYRVLALIPARGGSKGLHRKNLRELAGRPLIAWSIEQGLASKRIDKLVVSTEDQEIAAVAREFGADVPFMRPLELAADDSPVSEAILHAMHSLRANGETFDIVMLLECTSPVRYPGDIDNAIAALVDHPAAESVVAVVENTHAPPSWNLRLSGGYLSSFIPEGLSQENCRRQAVETTFLPYCLYLAWSCSYERYKVFYQPRTVPFCLKKEQMVEIDEEIDFFIAECIMKRYLLPNR